MTPAPDSPKTNAGKISRSENYEVQAPNMPLWLSQSPFDMNQMELDEIINSLQTTAGEFGFEILEGIRLWMRD